MRDLNDLAIAGELPDDPFSACEPMRPAPPSGPRAGGDHRPELDRALKRQDFGAAHDVLRCMARGGSATVDPITAAWEPLASDLLTAPPPSRRWLLRHPTHGGGECAPGCGDGLLPLGRAGVLTAEGGAGKTMALLQLGIATITGRAWLDHFHVDREAHGGRVLLALAEEDRAEVHRRLHCVAQTLGLSAEERALVVERLVVLPLAGRPVALVDVSRDGTVTETDTCATLRRLLAEHAGEQGWALVVLDPLARWGGGGVESDNDRATRYVQVTESLCELPGRPTVLVAHHSSKMARRAGGVDARGVTAITDGYRWEGQLRVADGGVYFRQRKSNYSVPMPDELMLMRERGGYLRAPSPAERAHRAEERAEASAAAKQRQRATQHRADVDMVVATAGAAAGAGVASVDALAAAAGVPRDRGRTAVAVAIDRGLLVRHGAQTRSRIYGAAFVGSEGAE